MKPRIDIDICDYEGKTAELCDLSTFEPYEVYINNEMVYTSERVKELEAENVKLREFAKLAWQVLTRNEPLYVWQGMVDEARELGVLGE